MTTYQLLPPLTADELARLEADIATHGVLVPIHIDEQGAVIDGHHRKAIAERHGFEVPHVVLHGLSEEDKVDRSLSLNLSRRNLSSAGKREVIAAYLRRRPEVSDRQAAELIGVSHPTVATVRAELESTGKIYQFDKRSGKDGKSRRARELTPEQIEAKARHDAKKAQDRRKRDEKTAPARAARAEEEAAMRARHEAVGGAVAANSRAPHRDRDLHERLIGILSTASVALNQALNNPDFDEEFAASERLLPVTARVDTARLKVSKLLSQLQGQLQLDRLAKASANGAESPLGEQTER
jgi:ParB-like chromosome segregation protein Spo0J